MGFRKGIWDGAAYDAARWIGGKITPEIVIVHDTASRLEPGSAARWLKDNPARVSCHFVIERDGSVIQQVPVDRRANHAGVSSYHGRAGCNGFSVGIEIVNPGRMTEAGGGQARAWWGSTFDIVGAGLEERATPQHGWGYWMPYTPEQIAAVEALLAALVQAVPTIRDIVPHWYVSPGRKVDTNPLFPLDALKARILGRDDAAADAADAASDPAPAERFGRVVSPSGSLNLRAWPSFNPNVLAAIPDGTVVPVLRGGVFAGREWAKVLFDGREGWVVARYLEVAP